MGKAIFGIGTNADNAVESSNVNVYPSNPGAGVYIGMNTQYNNSSYWGFLDTGSNFYYFNDDGESSIATCNNNNPSPYCPNNDLPLTISNQSINEFKNSTIYIGNAQSLLNNGNNAYSNIGIYTDPGVENIFDLGLPFFYGKTIYVGFNGESSSIASGAYWAF
jgi:hypothetical protein